MVRVKNLYHVTETPSVPSDKKEPNAAVDLSFKYYIQAKLVIENMAEAH